MADRLTKKEREAKRTRAALAWPTYPYEGPDVMPPPTSSAGISTGFRINVYSGAQGEFWNALREAWSSCIYHGDGPPPFKGKSRTIAASRDPAALYSTKVRALRALRHEVSHKFAAALDKIDGWLRDAEKEEKSNG